MPSKISYSLVLCTVTRDCTTRLLQLINTVRIAKFIPLLGEFKSVFKKRPATLPPLDAIGFEPVDHTHNTHTYARWQSLQGLGAGGNSERFIIA